MAHEERWNRLSLFSPTLESQSQSSKSSYSGDGGTVTKMYGDMTRGTSTSRENPSGYRREILHLENHPMLEQVDEMSLTGNSHTSA